LSLIAKTYWYYDNFFNDDLHWI